MDPNTPTTDRPNIVLVLADSLRARNVSCYGYGKPTTPNIDRLAQQGIKFENCFVQAPFTVASTACLLTGTYASVHRLERYGQRLSDSLMTMPELLRQSGYHTAAFVANPHVNRDSGLTRGFDFFSDGLPVYKQSRLLSRFVNWAENGRSLNRDVSAFLRNYAKQPLFLFVFYNDSHVPYSSLPRLLLPLIGNRIHSPDFDRYEYSDREMERILRLYDQAIRRVDARVGELIETVTTHLGDAGTLFLISADHGEGLDRRPSRGGHGRLYDNGIHVPLIAFGDRINVPGRSITGLVSSIDLSTTILDLAGLESPSQYQGKSIMSALNAQEFDGQSFVVSEYHDSRCIRTHEWKLIERGLGISNSLEDKTRRASELELYNFSTDRFESINCAEVPSSQEVQVILQAQLQDFYALQRSHSVYEPSDYVRNSHVAERLRGLGYIE